MCHFFCLGSKKNHFSCKHFRVFRVLGVNLSKIKMKIDWLLIKRSLTSSLNEEEEKALRVWLDEAEKHRAVYEDMKRFVAIRKGYRLEKDTREDFKKDFQARLNTAYRKRMRRMWMKVAGYAAMLVLPLTIVLFFFLEQKPAVDAEDYGIGQIVHGTRKATLVLNDGKVVALDTSRVLLGQEDGMSMRTSDQALVYVDSLQKDREVEVQNRLITPKGGEYTLMLSDGTKVWVNAATEIRYSVKFIKGERRVRLEGEAYFEVAKDTGKPFIVEIDGMEVKVYGTKFNINTRRMDRMHTTLVEGSVSVKPKGKPEVMLEPSQQAVFNKLSGRVVVQEVDVMPYVAWHLGNYFFENKSISEILDELALWYDINVFFMNDEVRNERFSGYLPRYGEIEKLLGLIEKTSHVHFEIKGKVIVVRK